MKIMFDIIRATSQVFTLLKNIFVVGFWINIYVKKKLQEKRN